MKKALWLTLGTVLTTTVVAPAYAYLNHTLVRQSAFSVTGTYTEVSNNGLSMGDYFYNASPSNFFERRAIFIDSDLKFDYALAYTYHICNTPVHFFMTYDHYHTGKGNTAVGPVVNIEVAPDPEAVFSGLSEYTGHADFRSDEFRIGFCHLLPFSSRFLLKVNAFFEWDKIKRTLYENALLSGENVFGSFSFPVSHEVERLTENEVKGWGFGVGTKAHGIPLPCYRHWGTFVSAKTTLLWAENDYYQALITEFSSGGAGDYIFNPESSHSLVGKLDISFGIDYCRMMMTDVGRFMLEVDLGMRYVNFINAIKNGNTYFNIYWPSNLNFGANTGFANDWGRIGPFLTFRLGGADA